MNSNIIIISRSKWLVNFPAVVLIDNQRDRGRDVLVKVNLINVIATKEE